MQSAPLPENEEERLKKLYELEILDTLEEQEYDDLTHMATQICGVPIALISLVDRDRQFLKSHHGLDVNEVSRELGFCPHAILDNDLTIVEDASKDARFFDNPLVTGGPQVKFYAGAPLIFSGDLRIGTICIVGNKPQTLTTDQKKAMQALARQVVSLLELRQAVKELEISNAQRSVVMAKLQRSEKREHARAAILEMLARDSSLGSVLQTLAHSIEDELEGAHCSILLLDEEGKRLLHGAAPGLPDFYIEAIHGLEIGPEVGSCGTAAFTGQRVIVEDVQTHPCWAPFKELTGKARLAACWSEPILDSDNKVLGTFAIYYSEPCAPDDDGLATIEYAANLAGIAIQRKRKEELLIQTKRAAEDANRAKSEFLSTMSHELRTPLTSIQGALGLLLGNVTGKLPTMSLDMLDVAHRNGERLMRLINDLLDISKIEAGKLELKLENHNLKSLLQQAIEVNKAYADRLDIKLRLNLPDEDICAMVDVDRFAQVMANLISNAVKFSHKNGNVEVSLANHDGAARVSVKDYGVGIAQEFHQYLFEKFTQQDSTDSRQRGGTGLGLAISKQLVKGMNGEIGFETEIGVGSEFYFDLPLADNKAV